MDVMMSRQWSMAYAWCLRDSLRLPRSFTQVAIRRSGFCRIWHFQSFKHGTVRHFWWNENSKNITYSWTAHTRCEEGTQRDTRAIRRLAPILCCESRTKFSGQTSCGEQDGGYSAEVPDGLHVHSNSGREQNSAMHHIRGNAQWSGDQLHVRSESWLWGLDEGNPATFWSFRFPQSSHPSMRQRDEYHWRVQKKLHANETREQCWDSRQNKSSEQRVCRSGARTLSGTRTMLPDTNRDEHWHKTFSNFTFHFICSALRWICALKIHSATRRQYAIPIFARNSIYLTFVHVWWIGICVDPRPRSASSQADEEVDQWLLVATRRFVGWTPGGDEAFARNLQFFYLTAFVFLKFRFQLRLLEMAEIHCVRKPLLSTFALKRRGVTIIFNHDLDRIIFSERDSEFGLSRLSFLPTHHSGEWNPTSQNDGDGWRECGKWRGWGSLRQRWCRETWGSRSFSWRSTSGERIADAD